MTGRRGSAQPRARLAARRADQRDGAVVGDTRAVGSHRLRWRRSGRSTANWLATGSRGRNPPSDPVVRHSGGPGRSGRGARLCPGQAYRSRASSPQQVPRIIPANAGRGTVREGHCPFRSRSRSRGEPQPHEPEPRAVRAAYALHLQAKEFMQRLGIRLTPLAVGTCDHRNEEPGYKPSRRLRHLTGARTVPLHRSRLPAACGAVRLRPYGSPMKRAAGPASAISVRFAVGTIGASRLEGGRWNRRVPDTWPGRRPRAAGIRPCPPATTSDRSETEEGGNA